MVGVEFQGTKYDMQYTLGSGYIKDLAIQRDVPTLTFILEGVNKNTLLTLKVPAELLFEVFSCGIEPPPRSPNYKASENPGSRYLI